MIPVSLVSLTTSDRIALEGIAVLPKRRGNTALIWIHGLTSHFARGQTMAYALSLACAQNRIAYFKCNTRGHDIAARGAHKGKIIGGGFERFEECILDIRAMVRFARSLGYRRIILTGHSTGANKVLYYIYKTRDPSVKGLVLLAPISDYSAEVHSVGKKELARRVALAKRLLKKNHDALMPLHFGRVISAHRYISLYEPRTAEDVFPYHDKDARWKELESIRVPLAVVFGSRDEHRDHPVQKLIDIFRAHAPRAVSFTGIVLKNADHGFTKKERELAHEIVSWIKQIT